MRIFEYPRFGVNIELLSPAFTRTIIATKKEERAMELKFTFPSRQDGIIILGTAAIWWLSGVNQTPLFYMDKLRFLSTEIREHSMSEIKALCTTIEMLPDEAFNLFEDIYKVACDAA